MNIKYDHLSDSEYMTTPMVACTELSANFNYEKVDEPEVYMYEDDYEDPSDPHRKHWEIGKVELLRMEGSDTEIVDAARVSFDKRADQYKPHENRGLIRYLYRNKHTSPFEMVGTVFRIKAPLFVARQWIRHRTAKLSHINEVSRRYVEEDPEFYNPPYFRRKNYQGGNKQGSSDDISYVEESVGSINAAGFRMYQTLLKQGIAPEEARMVLPQTMMTSWIWKIDLHNLLHFLNLRLDSHAQKEIRVFAEKIFALLDNTGAIPYTLEIFDEMRDVESTLRHTINNNKTYKRNLHDLAKDLNVVPRIRDEEE